MEQVALNLAARGIPFNTFYRGLPPASLAATPNTVSPYRGLGLRPKGFRATLAEYVRYELARNRILHSKRGKLALKKGGVVARLARGIVDPQTVCSGPTKNVHKDGHCIWDGIPTSPAYWDDAFTEEEVDIICGLYEHDGTQKKFASWWPTPAVWKSCGLERGYWTPSCEVWFQSRLAEIRAGNAELHNQNEWR
ncbi:hypothetical protein K438DRAFT_1581956, partial [Mycena galopus ATCC 62051]